MMKRPISGLTPSGVAEVNSMTVWPSIGAYPTGRRIGSLCGCKIGIGDFFTLGKLFALASIPVAAVLFFWRLLPIVGRSYTITNRRVLVSAGLSRDFGEGIALDAFDAVKIDVLPGQGWLHCGDVVFLKDGVELLRLPGVSRPEPFRMACLKAQAAMVQVREVVQRQAAETAQ